MADIGKFSEKIQKRLFLQEKEKAQKLLQLDTQMKQLLEKRERFNLAAYRILTSAVSPRMEELARNFENSKYKVEGLKCICEFSPTEHFPATVSLVIDLTSSGYYERLDIHYGLEIAPALMEYKRYNGRIFDPENPSCEKEISLWVEARIFDFIETYLQLETHPEYQKENYVTDVVCNMRFPIAQAASRLENEGRTFYFCSKTCKEAFLRERK